MELPMNNSDIWLFYSTYIPLKIHIDLENTGSYNKLCDARNE